MRSFEYVLMGVVSAAAINGVTKPAGHVVLFAISTYFILKGLWRMFSFLNKWSANDP